MNLDDPVHLIVDPWLKSQGQKSLQEMWAGDSTINKVTARELLQMRGGIQDYDDASLREWTVEHPKADWLPEDFIRTVDKKFLFAPGTGGAYSGVSFVLLGFVLSAASGAADWSKLQQQQLIEDPAYVTHRSSGTKPVKQR